MTGQTGFHIRLHCPVCAGKVQQTLLSVPFTDDRVWGFLSIYYGGRMPKEMLEGIAYEAVRCGDCGLVYQKNILAPLNMKLLYEDWVSAEESFSKKASTEFALFQGYSGEIEGIWKLFGGKSSQINVLEFGSGWGFWANMARSYGFNVTAVELSPSRIEYASRTGLKVISDLAQEKPESFHYIYSNQVFEHIADPSDVLRQLAGLLSPSGIIHLQVPNGRGMEKKLKDDHWKAEKDALHPLEHINCFTRSSLKVLALSAGLQLATPPVTLNCCGLAAFRRSIFRYMKDLAVSARVYMAKK